MTTSIKFVENKGQVEKVIIENAVLMYTKLKKAQPVYDQKDLPKHKQNMFEYTVDLVVDEDTSDLWDEKFPKQGAKKLLKAAFMKQFKLEKDEDFPEGLDPKAKKFYVIKGKQNTHYMDRKTNEVKPLSASTRPRVIAVIDGKKQDVTLTHEIGNCSVGNVMFTVTPNKTYGDAAKLKGVLVTNLVEYVSGGGDSDLTDFFGDDVEFAELPEEPEVSSTGKQSDEEAGGDFDDEPPFSLEDKEEDDF